MDKHWFGIQTDQKLNPCLDSQVILARWHSCPHLVTSVMQKYQLWVVEKETMCSEPSVPGIQKVYDEEYGSEIRVASQPLVVPICSTKTTVSGLASCTILPALTRLGPCRQRLTPWVSEYEGSCSEPSGEALKPLAHLLPLRLRQDLLQEVLSQ